MAMQLGNYTTLTKELVHFSYLGDSLSFADGCDHAKMEESREFRQCLKPKRKFVKQVLERLLKLS